jgi:hypothetical protein
VAPLREDQAKWGDVASYDWSEMLDEVDRLHVKRNGITY